MAISQELWVNKIKELAFPQNAYFNNAIIDSAYISGAAVEAPVSGTIAGATRNRAVLPGTAAQRTDVSNKYLIDEFSSDPIVITNLEETEASYDKFNSVATHMANSLYKGVGDWVSYKWANNVNVIDTTGTGRAAYLSTQTGNRKALTYADIMKVSRLMNVKNIPVEGRKMLIDGYMLEDLLNISQFQYSDSLMTGVIKDGSIGRVLGFDVYMRTPALIYAVGKTKVAPGTAAAATDNLGILCWHPDYVRLAIGTPVVFSNPGQAEWYGDLVSTLVRAGGIAAIPTTFDGVVSIIEVAA